MAIIYRLFSINGDHAFKYALFPKSHISLNIYNLQKHITINGYINIVFAR